MNRIQPSAVRRLMDAGRAHDRRIAASVSLIIERVRREGDRAVRAFTEKFDGVRPGSLRAGAAAWRRAAGVLTPAQGRAVREAARRIERYHRRQLPRGFTRKEPGCSIEFRYTPVRRVGICVPAGQAPLVSSLLMTAVPARVAGVQEIAVCSSPAATGDVHPTILAALEMLGIREVYRIGGAQAVAAMAYGTESIPACDLVCGPGNRFVDMAKRLVRNEVGIDLPAGPSEVAVFADSSARIAHIAADLAAQAEHTDGRAYLMTTSAALARAAETRGGKGYVVLVSDEEEAIAVINAVAPEHLQLVCRNARRLASRAVAGAVFIGPFTPTAFGDYLAGPSHILPTGRSARFSSGLSVMTFLRSYAVIEATRAFFAKHGRTIAELACLEGLPRHAESVEVRLKQGPG